MATTETLGPIAVPVSPPVRRRALALADASRPDKPLALLRGEPTTIGSGPRCVVQLTADGVQPLHCVIKADGGELTVKSWAPGVLLNGDTFEKAELAEGDVLSVGDADLCVVRSSEPLLLEPTAEPTTDANPANEQRLRTRIQTANQRTRQLIKAVRSEKVDNRILHDRVVDCEMRLAEYDRRLERLAELEEEVVQAQESALEVASELDASEARLADALAAADTAEQRAATLEEALQEALDEAAANAQAAAAPPAEPVVDTPVSQTLCNATTATQQAEPQAYEEEANASFRAAEEALSPAVDWDDDPVTDAASAVAELSDEAEDEAEDDGYVSASTVFLSRPPKPPVDEPRFDEPPVEEVDAFDEFDQGVDEQEANDFGEVSEAAGEDPTAAPFDPLATVGPIESPTTTAALDETFQADSGIEPAEVDDASLDLWSVYDEAAPFASTLPTTVVEPEFTAVADAETAPSTLDAVDETLGPVPDCIDALEDDDPSQSTLLCSAPQAVEAPGFLEPEAEFDATSTFAEADEIEADSFENDSFDEAPVDTPDVDPVVSDDAGQPDWELERLTENPSADDTPTLWGLADGAAEAELTQEAEPVSEPVDEPVARTEETPGAVLVSEPVDAIDTPTELTPFPFAGELTPNDLLTEVNPIAAPPEEEQLTLTEEFTLTESLTSFGPIDAVDTDPFTYTDPFTVPEPLPHGEPLNPIDPPAEGEPSNYAETFTPTESLAETGWFQPTEDPATEYDQTPYEQPSAVEAEVQKTVSLSALQAEWDEPAAEPDPVPEPPPSAFITEPADEEPIAAPVIVDETETQAAELAELIRTNDEPAAETDAPAEPESFIDRYRHLLPEEDDGFESDAAVPPLPVEPLPVEATPVAESTDSDDESIDDYMRKMMARIRGGEDADPQPEPATGPALTSEVSQPQTASPQATAASPELPALMEVDVAAPLQSLDELKPSPRAVSAADLDQMRSLANESARKAIDVANERQSREQVNLQFIGSIVVFCGGALAAITASTALGLQFIAGLIAMGASGWFFVQALRGMDVDAWLLKESEQSASDD